MITTMTTPYKKESSFFYTITYYLYFVLWIKKIVMNQCSKKHWDAQKYIHITSPIGTKGHDALPPFVSVFALAQLFITSLSLFVYRPSPSCFLVVQHYVLHEIILFYTTKIFQLYYVTSYASIYAEQSCFSVAVMTQSLERPLMTRRFLC